MRIMYENKDNKPPFIATLYAKLLIDHFYEIGVANFKNQFRINK